MLEQVSATRFVKRMANGRTTPALIECEHEDGRAVQVVTKCSANMMEHEKNLAIEAIAAMLASDLDLPVPEPFVVSISPEFVALVEDEQLRQAMTDSCSLAFGSKLVAPGFAVWPTGATVPESSCTLAAEIFVFDTIIVNADRRPENPNCLYRGDEFAIFDHELTLNQRQVLFWSAPWHERGFESLGHADGHIFAKPKLGVCPANLDRFVDAWRSLHAGRFQEYINALPNEWRTDEEFLRETHVYLRDAQTNIASIVDNGLRALR